MRRGRRRPSGRPPRTSEAGRECCQYILGRFLPWLFNSCVVVEAPIRVRLQGACSGCPSPITGKLFSGDPPPNFLAAESVQPASLLGKKRLFFTRLPSHARSSSFLMARVLCTPDASPTSDDAASRG